MLFFPLALQAIANAGDRGQDQEGPEDREDDDHAPRDCKKKYITQDKH